MQRTLFRSLQFCGFAAILALAACSTPKPVEPPSIALFNGKNLDGWSHVSQDASVPMDQVWSVQDGLLTCKGTPLGALYRGPDVRNFRLVVEYRWVPGKEPGNSGIFSRIESPLKPLPRAVEVQLKHGSAGDVLGLQGKPVFMDQNRSFSVKAHAVAGDIAGVRKAASAENPPGQWNLVEIIAHEGRYVVYMNTVLVNVVEGVDATSGPVGVQSEGGEIQFRIINLTPLP
jgi:hypothetical protein